MAFSGGFSRPLSKAPPSSPFAPLTHKRFGHPSVNMTSLKLEGKSSKPSSVTRRERVRENQQRSRDRRRKYIAELEQRVHGFERTQARADMQQEIFELLQTENLRLRELLATVGVPGDYVDTYVTRTRHSASTDLSTSESSLLRPLKPKFPALKISPYSDPAMATSSSNADQQFSSDMMASDNIASASSADPLSASAGSGTPYPTLYPQAMTGLFRTDKDGPLSPTLLAQTGLQHFNQVEPWPSNHQSPPPELVGNYQHQMFFQHFGEKFMC